MKSLFFASVLLVSLTSLAMDDAATPQGVLSFTVKSAEFSPNHVQNPGAAFLEVNYTDSTVTLTVQKKRICGPGGICAQFIPVPLVITLPITGIEVDSCNVKHITALKDSRPVDGALQKFTVLEPSQITCKTFVEVLPEATYETHHTSRVNGGDVVDVSQMSLIPTRTNEL